MTNQSFLVGHGAALLGLALALAGCAATPSESVATSDEALKISPCPDCIHPFFCGEEGKAPCCGDPTQAACASGETGCDGWAESNSIGTAVGTCVSCGQPGQAPCNSFPYSNGGESGCEGWYGASGAWYDNPTCVACGGLGQAPCTSESSQESGCTNSPVNMVVQNYLCVACGADAQQAGTSVGEPACSNGYCNEGANNDNGTCVECGNNGEQPCNECGMPDGPTCPLLNGGCIIGTTNVNGTCMCGEEAGEPPCTGASGPYCAASEYGNSGQPLDVVGNTCEACGVAPQTACDVNGTYSCASGFVIYGDTSVGCVACVVGQQSGDFCSQVHCADGTCQPGVISSCPPAGSSADDIQCNSSAACNEHGGEDNSSGCASG